MRLLLIFCLILSGCSVQESRCSSLYKSTFLLEMKALENYVKALNEENWDKAHEYLVEYKTYRRVDKLLEGDEQWD